MTTGKIDRLNPDAIQNLDDVRIWARQQEGRTEQRFDQAQAQAEENRKNITQNRWWLAAGTVGFGAAIAVVVVISGVHLIVRGFF